jgi:hypothetical protein
VRLGLLPLSWFENEGCFFERWIKWRPDRTIRRKRRIVGWEGWESDVESQRLQGANPCLCRLRTNRLVPANKYWTYWSHDGVMGAINWCSLSSTDACIFPIASMAVRGEKLGGDPWIGQPMCCRSGWELFFSGAVHLFNPIDGYMKGCRVLLVVSVYVSCVSGFSCKMYINLNHRDSRIWVTACLVVIVNSSNYWRIERWVMSYSYVTQESTIITFLFGVVMYVIYYELLFR